MIPDFFVVGAMKSATSTLCNLLSLHPSICMSMPKEPFVLSRDDAFEHPNLFFGASSSEWLKTNWELRKDQISSEYNNIFSHYKGGQICGEGSTVYLPSKNIAERISLLNSNSKIIIMLRNPVGRAYSHYWHLVSSGRAIYPFEKQIKYEPYNMLHRGLYREQIERYFTFFPRHQILVVTFEEFCINQSKQTDEVFSFLGVSPFQIDPSFAQTNKRNVARVPRSLLLQLFFNRLKRQLGADPVSSAFLSAIKNNKHRFILRLIDKLSRVNLSANKKYPEMDPEIQEKLKELFRRENNGLKELVDIDLPRYWNFLR